MVTGNENLHLAGRAKAVPMLMACAAVFACSDQDGLNALAFTRLHQ